MIHKIKATWEANVDNGHHHFDLEDVGCEVLEEWEMLSEQEKEKRLQEAIDSLPTTCYPILDKYVIIHKK
jgi:hypothetical protein